MCGALHSPVHANCMVKYSQISEFTWVSKGLVWTKVKAKGRYILSKTPEKRISYKKKFALKNVKENIIHFVDSNDAVKMIKTILIEINFVKRISFGILHLFKKKNALIRLAKDVSALLKFHLLDQTTQIRWQRLFLWNNFEKTISQ